MVKIKILIFSFLYLFNYAYSTEYDEIGIPYSKVFTIEQHLGSNQNWWLTQTKNGMIYNGTNDGITEWDGEKWRIYYTPNKSRVRSISLWDNDKIFVGTINDLGYFAANSMGQLTFTSIIRDWNFEQRQFGETWSTASNDSGVLFNTSKKMYFWDGKSVQSISDDIIDNNSIFAYGKNQFIYKHLNESYLKIVTTKPQLKIRTSHLKLPIGSRIRKIFYNNSGKLTVITSKQGIYEENDNKLILKLNPSQLPFGANIYDGIQANDGYYYMATSNIGIIILSENFTALRQYKSEHGIGMNTIFSILEDNQHNIWFSGESNIVKMFPPHVLSTYQVNGESSTSSDIGLLDNRVTIAGSSLYQLTQNETPLFPSYFEKNSEQIPAIDKFIEYKGHIFIAGDGGVYYFKISSDKKTEIKHIIKTFLGRSLAIDPITKILFAATYDGVYKITMENGVFNTVLIPNTEDELDHFIIDDEGILWLGTPSQELYKIINAQFDDKPTLIEKLIDKDGIANGRVIPFKISRGVVFGTNDGLMDYQKDRTPQLQFINDLPDEIFRSKGNGIYKLYEDNVGRIWFNTGKQKGYIQKNSVEQWEVHENIFRPINLSYAGFINTQDNSLIATSLNGNIFRFNIQQLDNPPQQGKLHIRSITNIDTNQELYGGLNNAKLPQLDQQHNSIRINYALTENTIINNKSYRYRLLGSDYEKWSNWSQDNSKDFTLLKGNDYTFQVEAKDAWGRLSKTELAFGVNPFWYLSKTAWMIYAITLLVLLALTAWIAQKWRTKNLKLRNLELENQVQLRTADVQAKAQQLKQQQVLKDRFFTNVSHEFRTPLTLIISPLTTLIEDHPKLENAIKHPVTTALRNAKKMLDLVAQVLDINRLESGRFPLRIAEYNLTDLIQNCVNRFQVLAKGNNQTIKTTNINEPLLMYFDYDQFDKCLSNLISNAIKYSGKNSAIEIALIEQENKTGICVRDNGKGISPEFENKIFERYTQDKNSESHSEPGTGIGLALVAELMALHRGEVELKNTPLKGCQFTLWLKNGKNHFDKSLFIEPITINSTTEIELPILVNNVAKQHSSYMDKTTLLIVDDNQELLEFIVSRFSTYYTILQANDGKQGLAIAQTQLPDLIISDVMMPKMSGLEMLAQLKNSTITNHIPIILLTAKSNKRDTVEGLTTGADDYITKPFDTSELIVRVEGLLKSRKMIREKLQHELSKKLLGMQSNTFKEKLRHAILKQLSNPKLDIEMLCENLAMSRSSLTKKCKSEINTSPAQYITSMRMEQALTLLKSNKHSISEIAYGVGFESLAYFSKSFKKFFGYTPSSVK